MLNLGRKEQIILIVLAGIILFGGGYKLAERKLTEKPIITKSQLGYDDALVENNEEIEGQEDNAEEKEKSSAKTQEKSGIIVVHVTGAVLNPGIFELPEGSRVNDALTKAVLKDDAYTDGLNLAQVLHDEDQIIVPDANQAKAQTEANSPFGIKNAANSVSSSTTSVSSTTGKVNINTADQNTLENLPGIGPSYAQKIIEYRQQKGSFKSPEELKNVSGIGEKRYEALKDLITI